MRGIEETVALALVLLVILGGAVLYWWYYLRPKPAEVTPVTPTPAPAVGLPKFGEAKISVVVNESTLLYNASAGELSHTIKLTVSNKGSDDARTIIAGVILPEMLKYYVNSDESGWNKLNFTGLLGSKGYYIYKDEIKSSEKAEAEYTLALFPQAPAGNYTIYFVVITLDGATEDTFIKLVPVTVQVA